MARSARRGLTSGSDLAPEWADVSRARRRVARVTAVLARTYGTPDLGNLRDPLDEAAFIILTFQTDIPRARLVWSAFRERFTTWAAVLAAPESDLADVLRPAGLHVARARLVRLLLNAVQSQFGALSLDPLRTMPTADAEAVLRELPGLDRKSARCVLLYSLERPVFPVDSNTHRFAVRYGILREGTPYRRARVHDELQEIVPSALRHDLHVNLVVHGQRTCTPREPRCPVCPVRRTCAMGRRVLVSS